MLQLRCQSWRIEPDIIVSLAGQSIGDIYDYTYALDVLKEGEPTEVIVMRDEERLVLELIPEARE